MSINEQLANQVAAEGGVPIDPSKPHFAISEEMRGHIEQDYADEVTGSEVWPATDWGVAPGKQGLYVYSRATNETHRLPFD